MATKEKSSLGGLIVCKKLSFPRVSFGDLLLSKKQKKLFVFAKRWSHRSEVFATSFIVHLITQFSHRWIVSASKSGAERAGFAFVLSWHRFDTRSVDFFFPVYFSASFKTQNIYLKKNCAASKSTFEGFAPKDAAQKTKFFLHTLFLENEVQINKNSCKATGKNVP